MPIADAIVPHLPYLRRYARALTGSQASADVYVRATLEAIIADPGQFDWDLSPHTALYRVFHAIWESSHFRDLDERTLGRSDGELCRRLRALTPPFREALLLSVMEGCSHPEVAAILNIKPQEVPYLVDGAMRGMMSHPPTSVLIIEDEPLISADLCSIVQDMGHSVSAIASTRSQAVDAARSTSPGLVLADIQLGDDSSGLDAVKDILSDESVPVIFITAYPERFLAGSRPEPAFLISKPFIGKTVRSAINQALYFHVH